MAEDALVGQTLTDKYRVVRQIGRGGMGVVYEAEHVQLGKRVAIKLMLEKYAEAHASYRKRIEDFCTKKHVAYQAVQTDVPFDEAVLAVLRRGGLLG